jgi:SAM-dependent methyltransferase
LVSEIHRLTGADSTTGERAPASERLCPACGSESRAERGEKHGLRVTTCRDCGTLYAHFVPRRRSGRRRGYDTYYHEANLSVPAFIMRRLDEIVGSFSTLRSSNRLLDVGCGAGSLLAAARRAGWEAEGTELSLGAVEHVRREGLKVFHGELAEAQYPSGYFDVVTASEILEHVPDPRAMLAEVARILRPGGTFWATTPHGRGLSARVLGLRWSMVSPPEHLHLFSLEGVRRMLRETGFSRARVTSEGCNPYELCRAWRRDTTTKTTTVTTAATASTENSVREAGGGYARVATSYRLNEALMKNSLTRVLKATLNGVLGAARGGDSIKIRAIK